MLYGDAGFLQRPENEKMLTAAVMLNNVFSP